MEKLLLIKFQKNIDVGVKIDTFCVKLQSRCKVNNTVYFDFLCCITLEVNNCMGNFVYPMWLEIHRSPDLKHFLFASNGAILFLKQTITLLT